MSSFQRVLAGLLAGTLLASSSAASPDIDDKRGLRIDTSEQMIYATVLNSWLGKSRQFQWVNRNLEPAPSPQDAENAECVGKANFPVTSAHPKPHKTIGDAAAISPKIKLIDGSAWKPSDPGLSMAQGKSVNASVNEGFSHSLISLSEVAFSSDRRDALVSFSMTCGSLCGTGFVLRLYRTGNAWAVKKRCGGYVS